MRTINDLLTAEMAASEQFTRENFGLKVGDGFPEMVKELCRDEKIPLHLVMGMIMQSLSGKSVGEAIASFPDGQKPDMGTVVLKNVAVFETPLSLLYWGIQIGRKLERAETEALARISKEQTLLKLDDFLSGLQADMLATGDLKMPVAEAKSKGLCASCGEPAIPKCYSDAGRREFQISGLCELCYDAVMKEDE